MDSKRWYVKSVSIALVLAIISLSLIGTLVKQDVLAQTWPTSWIQIDSDPNEGGTDNFRDVITAWYNFDTNYLYLRLCCVNPAVITGENSRYKWFFDMGIDDDPLQLNGNSWYGADYLLFVEDRDDDTVGEVYLLQDTDADGLFSEYENPNDYTIYEVTDTSIAYYRIDGNCIDLYVNFFNIGTNSPNNISLVWATDNENSNLVQAPNVDTTEVESAPINLCHVSVGLTGDLDFCHGASTLITAAASGGTGPYTYVFTGTAAGTDNGDGTFTATGSGTVHVEATDDNGCTDEDEVTVAEAETGVSVGLTGDLDFCHGASTLITAAASGGTEPYDYVFTGTAAGTDNGDGTFTATGSGTVHVEATDDNGCTDEDEVTVDEADALTCTIIADSPVCVQSKGNTASTATSGGTYAWTMTGGTITSDTNIQTITYTAGTGSPVHLEVTVTKDGCSNTCTEDVTVIMCSEPAGSIGDTVFYDNNGNGNQDPGEGGIAGVQAKLYQDDGDGLFNPTWGTDTYIGMMATGPGGSYLFSDLPPFCDQGYWVLILENTLPPGVVLTTGSNPLGPICIEGVQYYSQADFGYNTTETEVVPPPCSYTTVKLYGLVNPSVYGQRVTFRAVVMTGPCTVPLPTPTGKVTFRDLSKGQVLGTVKLDASGQALLTTWSLPVGIHYIMATYYPDASYRGSNSPSVTQIVNKSRTSTTLRSSVNPSAYNQMVTFTATVRASAGGSGRPTGIVTFKDLTANKVLGTAHLNTSGMAKLSTSLRYLGTHSIVAIYGGDGNFISSTSRNLFQRVR
ncbi:Ig-like domain repeat protein [Chloroflexota bacterium]